MDELKPMEQRNEPSTEEIVRSLRNCADAGQQRRPCTVECYYFDKPAPCADTLYSVAADRLESQEREIERLKEELEQMEEAATVLHAANETHWTYIKELTARAEQAERERDAAKEVFNLIKGWLRNAKREGGSYADALSAISLVVRHWDEGRYLRGQPQEGEGK